MTVQAPELEWLPVEEETSGGEKGLAEAKTNGFAQHLELVEHRVLGAPEINRARIKLQSDHRRVLVGNLKDPHSFPANLTLAA